MDMMSQALQLFVKFATIGGGLWTVWGVITGSADSVWCLAGCWWRPDCGCGAALLEYRPVASKYNGA